MGETGIGTGIETELSMPKQMHPALRAYLILGVATFVACALVAAHAVLIAPSTGYKVLILTNLFGEGGFEAALIVAMIPAWIILLRRMIMSI